MAQSLFNDYWILQHAGRTRQRATTRAALRILLYSVHTWQKMAVAPMTLVGDRGL